MTDEPTPPSGPTPSDAAREAPWTALRNGEDAAGRGETLPPPPPWPSAWGAAPPVWQPPTAGTPPPRSRRRGLMLAAAPALALGLVAGGAAGWMAHASSTSSTPGGTVSVPVDTRPPSGGTGTVEAVAAKLGPAVGTIIARHADAAQDALGSGFVFGQDSSGSYLLTNNHVVSGAQNLNVVMPGGKNLAATVVGTDALDDLAVIRVPDNSLPKAVLGDSTQVHVGEAVVAIGSPLGNEGSVTSGVISALHRTISAGSEGSQQSETLQDVLQTDASINPGNSGGPLADTEGRVIGVNVAVAGNANNIGFSIPISVARGVADDLVQHRKVQHPFLGIGYLTNIDATEQGRGFDGPGVLVSDVRSGTPADKAGFHVGDILQKVGDLTLDNGETLGGAIQAHKVGDSVTFTVRRGDQTLTLTATLVDRPASTQ